MRSSLHDQLRQVAHLQNLRADAAEARLRLANDCVCDAESARDTAVAQRDGSADAWQASIGYYGMAADVTWSWAEKVQRDDIAAVDFEHQLADREADARAFAVTYRRQLIVRDAAIAAARAAERIALRNRDERRLHDVTERLMQRRRCA